MDSKLKVTDVPEEASFYDLVAGDNVLEIPLFQRPYMWKVNWPPKYPDSLYLLSKR